MVNQLSCSRKDLRKKYGKWALVTGSTDGIGLAMARELARRGHSIIIVGRNEEKLERVARALQDEPGFTEVLSLKIDLTDSSQRNYERARSLIDPDNRDIGILINSAGISSRGYHRLSRLDEEHLTSMINVNILATVAFTRMILPGMLKRKRGLVMNVSSQLANVACPYMGLYGPTKAFVSRFSENLQLEHSTKPIDIVNLETGPVPTKLLRDMARVNEGLFSPSPENYARSTLNAVATPVTTMSGTLAHELLNWGLLVLKALGLWSITSHFVVKMTSHRETVGRGF